jgi:hypothetical protein
MSTTCQFACPKGESSGQSWKKSVEGANIKLPSHFFIEFKNLFLKFSSIETKIIKKLFEL